jgi:hypothetical protein
MDQTPNVSPLAGKKFLWWDRCYAIVKPLYLKSEIHFSLEVQMRSRSRGGFRNRAQVSERGKVAGFQEL